MTDEIQDPAEEVQEALTRTSAAIQRLKELNDPAVQGREASRLLKDWQEHQPQLRDLRRTAVLAMRAQKPPVSYRKIAAAIGVSVARVQQIEVGETSHARSRKGTEPTGSPE